MNMTYSDSDAFPTDNSNEQNGLTGGLTKREYFAGQIMGSHFMGTHALTLTEATKAAVRGADALIKALNETEDNQ